MTSFKLDGKIYDLDIVKDEKGCVISMDGEQLSVDTRWISEDELSIIIDGKSYVAVIGRSGNVRTVEINGESYRFEKVEEGDDRVRGGQDSAYEELSSPMPGKVIKVNIKKGDEVKKGTSLIIVEAMKMENEIRASRDSVVEKIMVKEGDLVEAGATLVDLKPLEE